MKRETLESIGIAVAAIVGLVVFVWVFHPVLEFIGEIRGR